MKNVNENLIPMPITVEDALKMGFARKDVVNYRIGIKNVKCVMVDAGKDTDVSGYMKMLDNEQRGALREKRCLIPDGKGGSIRCPECNHCNGCEKKYEEKFNTGKPLSLEGLTWGDDDDTEERQFDVPGKADTANDAIAYAMLDELLEYLRGFEGERLDEIFQMLFEIRSTQEIADELGVAWSTAKDAIKKVQKLAQEYTRLTK